MGSGGFRKTNDVHCLCVLQPDDALHSSRSTYICLSNANLLPLFLPAKDQPKNSYIYLHISLQIQGRAT